MKVVFNEVVVLNMETERKVAAWTRFMYQGMHLLTAFRQWIAITNSIVLRSFLQIHGAAGVRIEPT